MRRHQWGPIAALLLNGHGVANGRVAVSTPIAAPITEAVSYCFANAPSIWWVAKKGQEGRPCK